MTFSTLLTALALAACALSIAMGVGWIIWRVTGNSGWVDATWTFSVGLIGAGGAVIGGGLTARSALVAICVILWAFRLGLHIADRTTKISDDPRYATLILGWGEQARRQMFWFLQKQAWVSIPLVASVWLAAWSSASALRIQDLLGALVIVIAILGETAADGQLKKFRTDPTNRSRLCDRGLWSLSRHPNYFFEWFGWLAYPLIAVDLYGTYSWGWLSLAAPLCMYWLLVYVSGIPPLEAHMLAKHGAVFREYQSRTNAFFPGPPRRRAKT